MSFNQTINRSGGNYFFLLYWNAVLRRFWVRITLLSTVCWALGSQVRTDLPLNWEQNWRCTWWLCPSGTRSIDRWQTCGFKQKFLELSTPFWVWDNSLYPTDNIVRWSYTCKVIKNQYCDTTVSSNSHFCFSEKYKVAVEDLPSALEDVHPSPFCEPCERNGKLKMTAGTYCVTCGHKFCAAHQKVPKYIWN